MSVQYPPKVQKALDSLLKSPAVTTSAFRKAVEAHAARLGGGNREADPIPEDLKTFVNKVAMNAYKVTDEDIHLLKTQGYSEDAIFEITLCASLGAGLARFESGMRALKGGGE